MSGEIIDLSARQMAKVATESGHVRYHMPMAIEQIVDAYVRLKDGRALLDLRAHRHRLIVDLNKLRSDSDYNVSLALGKMAEDLAIINVGIEQLEAQGDIGAIVRALPASPRS